MAIIGYARVSTFGQSLKDQVERLKVNGAENIYQEKFTGSTTNRPVFSKVLEQLQADDVLMVTKLDRLARNTREALEVIDNLRDRQVKINVLNMGIVDDSPIGKVVTTLLLSVAEMERDMIVQRTTEGKEYAKKHNPQYKEGRPHRRITPKYRTMYEFLKTHSYSETAQAFELSRSTVYQVKKQIEKEQEENNS